MQRIVSLLPSITEITCALGFEGQLVGRSHECDHPQGVTELPVLTEPKLDAQAGSREIDDRVKALVRDGLSVYRVDAATLTAGSVELEVARGRGVVFKLTGVLDLETPERRVEAVHRDTGIILAFDSAGADEGYYFPRLPVGIPITLVRSVDRETGRPLVDPLILGEGDETHDLGRMELPRSGELHD